jgi:adenine-specific DNA-methyltransferase
LIKYLGSKRRLVPALSAIARAVEARTALDLFTGTTRVAQTFKQAGAHVTAVDTARYAHVFARCYIGTDARSVDQTELAAVLAGLDDLPGRPGYVTEVFCRQARFFQPENGARIDAIRDAISRDWAGSPLEPILLTSLIEAADRVDSTTGVQMAYVKRWADRSHQPLRLRVPELLPGDGTAILGDAVLLAPTLPAVELAYLDPPYNQHRYTANYHVWETLVAWDAPPHYGVACKRADLRDPETRSVFNARRAMPVALKHVIESLDADVLVASCSDEGWVTMEDLREWCAPRGHVAVLSFDSRRYVGAQIGVFNPQGKRVGEPTRMRNVEYLVLCGERGLVERCCAAVAAAASHRQAPNVTSTIGARATRSSTEV